MTATIKKIYGSSDDTYNLYEVDVHGSSICTQVTCNPSKVDKWILDTKAIHPRQTVGLDVEWAPHLNKYIKNPAATLQLCVNNRCLIFQLLHCPDIPPSLAEFLNNASYTFVGVDIANDATKLLQDHKLRVAKTVDLTDLAVQVTGSEEHRKGGLKTLAKCFLDLDVDKTTPVRWSPWDRLRLTPEQVQYACVDAYVSMAIGCTLLSKEAQVKPVTNVHGYAVPGGAPAPAREGRLPCCGNGFGWCLFILGFFLAGIPWYCGAIILLCFRTVDYREKPGYIACAIAAVLVTIGITREASQA